MEVRKWDESEEAWLVKAAQSGDLRAFDTLVRKYRSAALTVARLAGRPELAEDVVQDAFLAAFAALPGLADPTHFTAWFSAIVRNRAKKVAQGEARPHVPLDDLVLAYVPALMEDVADQIEAREVRNALEALNPELVPAMRLYYFEGWPVRKIAELLALPVTTVKWRLHAGRLALRGPLAYLEEPHE